jgi:acyl-CoA hydrolase
MTDTEQQRILGLLRPGDAIIWGQGTAEPLPLTEFVVSERARLRPLSVFLGVCFSESVRPEHLDALQVSAYGTFGSTRKLAAGGGLQIIPGHISQLDRAIELGRIGCDVAIVQLSAPGPNGKPSLGPINDYIRTAMARARVVIAEVNEQMPWTYGPEPVGLDRIAARIRTSRPLLEAPIRPPTEVDRAIARHAAAVIPDGATLQVGIGSTIDALLESLGDRRDLGVHSGMIADPIVSLIERGVVTNARKPIDAGITVTAALFGGRRLFRTANRNPDIVVMPYTYTHAPSVLAQIDNLVAINSAVEVDVTGQVNSEVANGRYVGAIGGQVDFMHAAARAPRGCSIIALPSTSDGAAASRIRVQVDTVTCARSEVDFIVTEYGAADLRSCPLRERMRRLIAIAHPDFREALEREAEPRLRRGY